MKPWANFELWVKLRSSSQAFANFWLPGLGAGVLWKGGSGVSPVHPSGLHSPGISRQGEP